ncbi:MAG: hypothetical protein ACTSR0_05085 [Candidatus Asgardarchaeia archaeon]
MDYDEQSGLYVAKIPAFQAGKCIEYKVIAEDVYGNVAESNTYSYEVKAIAPSIPIEYIVGGILSILGVIAVSMILHKRRLQA